MQGKLAELFNVAKRVVRVAWKPTMAAAVVILIVYRVRFAPVPVASQRAGYGPIVAEVMGTGTLEPRVQATISPKITGLLTRVLADQGDRVPRGQLLAVLDDRDLRQQVEVAKAELAAAQATVDRSATDIVRSDATVALARTELSRISQLRRSDAATATEFDQVRERHDVAEADARRARLAKVEAEKAMVTAEQRLSYYRQRLADTKITSPFDGLVVQRSREPGDVVVPGSEILRVVSTEQMWVSAWVDETAMASLAGNQPARVIFRSEPDKSYRGTVARRAPLADRETREFLVDVTVNELPKIWAVGQRAEVYIQTAKKDQALCVPQRAIVWQKGRPGLFVNDAGHARWRRVELGLHGAETVEVTDGLTAGETVVWVRDPKDGPLTGGRAVSVP